MTGWRSLVRGVALVAYAIGLPFAILSLASAVWTLIADGPQPALVGMATGALAFAALIVGGSHLSATVTARELRGRDAQIELDFTDTSVSGSAKVPLIGTVTIKEGTKIAE